MILPGAIHSTQEWCMDHPTIHCYADVMLACSTMHGDLSELLNTIKISPDPTSTPSQGMSFKYILYNANREHQTWQDLWFGPNRKLDRVWVLGQLLNSRSCSSWRAAPNCKSDLRLLWHQL